MKKEGVPNTLKEGAHSRLFIKKSLNLGVKLRLEKWKLKN